MSSSSVISVKRLSLNSIFFGKACDDLAIFRRSLDASNPDRLDSTGRDVV